MPVSQKQLLANRHNAQKSTGPKTALGKFRSSRNALKHGLYSHFNLYRAFQFLSPKNQARYLSAFINELFPGYSGNKSKTHSDLTENDQNSARHKNIRQKKNKPISGAPSQSPQPILRQKITGKKSRSEMI
jgi:hypothetical protein